MGLLERLKLNKTKDFFEWLDLILKNELNSEIKELTLIYMKIQIINGLLNWSAHFHSIGIMMIGLVMKSLLQEIILS